MLKLDVLQRVNSFIPMGCGTTYFVGDFGVLTEGMELDGYFLLDEITLERPQHGLNTIEAIWGKVMIHEIGDEEFERLAGYPRPVRSLGYLRAHDWPELYLDRRSLSASAIKIIREAPRGMRLSSISVVAQDSDRTLSVEKFVIQSRAG